MLALSELLGAAALAREGRRPLTEVLESVSLRQVMAQTTGPPLQVQRPNLLSKKSFFTLSWPICW